MIYIVIPVFNRWHFTKSCLMSLRRQTYQFFKIIVVDHGSTDRTSEQIEQDFPEVILLKGDKSMWWTAATNLGVKFALGTNADYILTLNNDLIVHKDYLESLINVTISNPKSLIGSISVDIQNKESIAFAGTKWNSWLAKYKKAVPINLPYSIFKNEYSNIKTDLLPGRGTLIPVSVFKDVGLFDDINFPHYMADEDFSIKAKNNGYNLLIDVNAAVYSHLGDTGLNNTKKNKSSISHLIDTFTSIKSPNKISVRWNWAQNAKIPIIYFLLDFGRVIISQLSKALKTN